MRARRRVEGGVVDDRAVEREVIMRVERSGVVGEERRYFPAARTLLSEMKGWMKRLISD